MTATQRLALYDNELDKLLIDCFQPYAGMIKENSDDYKECAEHFGLTVDSAEFLQILQQPY